MAIKKAKVTIKEGAIVWMFENGEEFVVNPEIFNQDVQNAALLHGLKQKLSDTYAGCKTATEASIAFKSVLDALKQGDWNRGRSSSGGIWVEALARAAKVSLDDALAKWTDMDEEQQKALKAHKGIKLAKAQIEMEKATKAAEVSDEDDLPEFLKDQAI